MTSILICFHSFKRTIDIRQATLKDHTKKAIKFNRILLIVGMEDISIPASCVEELENQVLGVHRIANGVASGKSAKRKEVINTYVFFSLCINLNS